MTAQIEASHLRKSFGSTLAVEDVSLRIREGEIYGLVGSDGAGKTTTIRLLAGALKPDSGEASLGGYSVARQIEQARAQIGYLSQRFSLYEDLTVMENIRFFAELRGLSRREWLPRCLEILEFVGLEGFKQRRAGQLSGGMKQKLGLASALVSRPPILLLDEPTTGVDPVTRQDFWQLLIRLVRPHSTPAEGKVGDRKREGVSILLATPYMDEASRCSRVGFMRKGRIIAEGTPSELRDILNDRILELRGKLPASLRADLESLPGVEDVRAFGDKLHLRTVEGEAGMVLKNVHELNSAARGLPLEVRGVPPTLEDVFLYLSKSEEGTQ